MVITICNGKYWLAEKDLKLRQEKLMGEVEYMFMTLGSILGRLLHLKRTCPKCKRDQIVPSARKHEAVSCRFCGARIPPSQK